MPQSKTSKRMIRLRLKRRSSRLITTVGL